MSELDALLRSGTGAAVLEAILEAMPSFAFIADSEGRILRASRFVADLSGLAPEVFEGRPVADLSILLETADKDGRLLAPEELPIARGLKGEKVLGFEGSVLAQSGERVPLIINAAPFRADGGQVIGVITAASDRRRPPALERELRAAVAETEVLYRELAHRVKNHFQLISNLVALEARNTGDSATELAGRMIGRLKMLAAVYDRMNQADVGGRIGARAFIEDVIGPYRTDTISINVSAPEALTLGPDEAGPLGMLVNEAVNNSYKHAFPRRRGRIAVCLRPGPPGRLELTVADDGIGFAGPAREGSQGVRLMRLLANQLGGEMETVNRPAGGAQVVVDLPASLAQG